MVRLTFLFPVWHNSFFFFLLAGGLHNIERAMNVWKIRKINVVRKIYNKNGIRVIEWLMPLKQCSIHFKVAP